MVSNEFRPTPIWVKKWEKGVFWGPDWTGGKGRKRGEKRGFWGGGGGCLETLKVPKSPLSLLDRLVKIGGKTPPFWYSNN